MNMRTEQVRSSYKEEKKDSSFSHTLSSDRAWKHFIKMIQMKEIQEKVSALRQKYEIPKQGFDLPPTYNERAILPSLPQMNQKKLNAINLETKEIIRNFGFHCSVSPNPLETFVFYNKIIKPRTSSLSLDRCRIRNISIDQKNKSPYILSIEITSETSLREILSFVEKKYATTIEPIQKIYRSRIAFSKTRPRNPVLQERDNFIYELDGTPHKKIASLVREKFDQSLSYNYISKIISTEKKKRNTK